MFCTNYLLFIAGLPTALTLPLWILPVIAARLLLIRRIKTGGGMLIFWMATVWIMAVSIPIDRWFFDAGYCGHRPLPIPAGPW